MGDDDLRCRFCNRPLTDAVCPCGREEIPVDLFASDDLESVLRERDAARDKPLHLRRFRWSFAKNGVQEVP